MKYIIQIRVEANATINIKSDSYDYEELKPEAELKVKEMRARLTKLGLDSFFVDWNYLEFTDANI